MKRFIDCKIESIASQNETAWIISMSEEAAFDAALLLAILNQGKIPQVKFADQSRSAVIHTSSDGYTLALQNAQIAVTQTWLEALMEILMDVYLNGWSDTAHLDQDFENVSVTVAVLPPEQ